MAELVGRNPENAMVARLQRLPRQHRRSVDAEVGDILRNAVKGEGVRRKLLGSRLRERFASFGLKGDLPEWRGEVARPATFEA